MALDYWKLLTVVVAAFAVYIAYQQYRLQRERFKLDLFEKRFAVFAATRKLLSIVLRDARINLDELFEYRAAVSEAAFLFDEDITKCLERIDATALRLITLRDSLDSVSPGEKRSMIVDRQSEVLKWLTDQLPELKRRFAPYLRFETWKPVVVANRCWHQDGKGLVALASFAVALMVRMRLRGGGLASQ